MSSDIFEELAKKFDVRWDPEDFNNGEELFVYDAIDRLQQLPPESVVWDVKSLYKPNLPFPGCRAERRQRTNETEFDLWCQFEGLRHDFRKEIGHYFIVECKNWKKVVGFDEIAKFALVLISNGCRIGSGLRTSHIRHDAYI